MKKLNETCQSISKPIESDGGQPFHSYSTITDINGNGISVIKTDDKKDIGEFEETSTKVMNFKEFNRKKFKLTPPFEDDLISNSDFVVKSTTDELAEMDKKGEKLVKEDVAMSGGANVSGMGAVVTAQPSSIPGDTAGSTIGSGDIGAGQISACKKINTKFNKKRKLTSNKVLKFSEFETKQK